MSKKDLVEYFLLSIILIGAFIVRLYKINNPVADWHSWRQADTAAVSRNFLKYGFDLLHPRFDDISSLPSGKENPQGYRFVEFPFYNLIHAYLAKSFPSKNLEWWGRMVSIIFSLGSLIFLYLITKKYLGVETGLLAAFFFAFLPFNIYYSRVILPEPTMVFSTLGMIYFFAQWLEQGRLAWLYYFLFFIFVAISLLLKPFTIFLFPVLFYLAWHKWRTLLFRKWSLYLAILAIVPFFLWRWWMSHYPEGIPYYPWLFNHEGIRFKGAFFRWIFGERLGKLILGSWGLIPFTFGIISNRLKKEGWLFYFWLVGILIYFAVIAGGNVIHDYYQIISVPIICVFLAKGAHFLLTTPKSFFDRAVYWSVLIVSVLFMLAFSWYEVRGFFNINHPEIIEAGKAVDRLVPKNAKVIAPYNGDTAFLHQTNRQGWPAMSWSIDYLISRGANFYASVNLNDKDTQELMLKYPVLEKTDKYVIISLQGKK